MSLFEKAKAATDTAAQKAAELRGQASELKGAVADRASSLTEQTRGLASDVRDKAGALSASLADAAFERANLALGELNATLPILKRAGYTITEVSVQVGVPPKISAVFALAEEVPDDQIEQLLAENAEAKLAALLVHTLVRAHKLEGAMQVGGLRARGIAIDVGLTPSVTIKFVR
jgi:hypothetical protein